MYDTYLSSFEAVVADNSELRDECFSIRYLAFCEESPILRYQNLFNSDKMERDEYDGRSVHGLLRHKNSGLFIGACRLVLNTSSETSGTLPVHHFCSAQKLSLPVTVPGGQIAELSRLCVSKTRYAQARNMDRKGNLRGEESISPVMLGLFRLFVRCSIENDILHWYAAVEPSLFRYFNRLGMRFNAIGSPIEYHGTRQVCYANVDEWLARIGDERPDVWDILSDKGAYKR